MVAPTSTIKNEKNSERNRVQKKCLNTHKLKPQLHPSILTKKSQSYNRPHNIIEFWNMTNERIEASIYRLQGWQLTTML